MKLVGGLVFYSGWTAARRTTLRSAEPRCDLPVPSRSGPYATVDLTPHDPRAAT